MWYHSRDSGRLPRNDFVTVNRWDRFRVIGYGKMHRTPGADCEFREGDLPDKDRRQHLAGGPTLNMNTTRWSRNGILALLTLPWIGGSAPVEAAKAKVSLVPAVDGVVAGQAFGVGVRFQLEAGWHLYWQNSGDAGTPPTVKWSLPEGFTAGELQFPIPKRHHSPGDIVTNILPGEPVLMVSVTPPASLVEGSYTLRATVRYLVCKDTCLQESAEVAVNLRAHPPGGEAKPANDDVLNRARRALPKASNKYVSVVPSLPTPRLDPATKFELALSIDIAPGHHIQSHQPLSPTLIAADVFTERRPGIRLGKPVYPAPKMRKDQYLGELSEFDGRIVVRVPGEVDASRERGPVTLAGVFAFQACDELGHCFPPDAVSFSLPTGVADAAAGDGAVGSANTPTPESRAPTDESQPGGWLSRLGIPGLLLGCFLYGLFINATPCVLPLLSIKVLGFVQQAHESRRRTLALGLAFGAGVMVFFVVLGFLAAAGTNILQFPGAVIGLGTVVMAMGLSMLGVFTLQPPTAAAKLEERITKEGPLSSFGKGALAPVLGFACTGPLLAGAFGWATQQPPRIAVLAFLSAGLGMSSPYMLLGANPHWLSFLPRPGNWMIVFERIMGFLLLAMVIWLLHPLVVQIGVAGLEWTMVFLIFVGLACWVLGQVRFDMSAARRWAYRGAAGALVILAGGVIYEGVFPLDEAVAAARAERDALANCANGESSDELRWRPWSPTAVEETVRSGKMAFVDFTAAYCTVCKVNKIAAIDTPEVAEKLKSLGAAAFQGDFTTGDDDIFAMLQKYDRAGVPLNLIYPAGRPDTPIVLPTTLSKAYLLQRLEEAAASRSASAATLHP